MARHLYRNARLGAQVLIKETWYQSVRAFSCAAICCGYSSKPPFTAMTSCYHSDMATEAKYWVYPPRGATENSANLSSAVTSEQLAEIIDAVSEDEVVSRLSSRCGGRPQ